MIIDFSPAAAHRIPPSEPSQSPSATDLARSYGLEGQWTVGGGVGLLAGLLDGVTRPWFSRMVQPRFTQSWHASQVEVIPAVGGRTVWPEGAAPAVLVETPNRVGVLEDLVEAASHGALGVLLRPVLAGDLTLPAATRAVAFELGRDTISIAPGPDAPLEGLTARWAAVDRSVRRTLAEEATARARRLAKKLNQLRSVSAPLGPPVTGTFVVTTPRDPYTVLESMRHRDVAGGIPALLPEHPGGIAVTCTSDHSESDLDRHVDAMAAALA